MDREKLENKAKPMKKRNVQLVHEHFEEVLTQLSSFSLFVQWSHKSVMTLALSISSICN
jgi:hypothetical protein